MHIQGRVRPVAVALVFALVAFAVPALARDGKAAKKIDKAQQAEFAAAVRTVDGVMAGQPAPADFAFTWMNHSMKSLDGKTYVPFLLLFDKDQKVPSPLAYYIRVVNKATIGEQQKKMADYKAALEKAEMSAKLDPENVELADAAEKLRAQAPRMEYAFEDFRTFNFTPPPGAAFRLPGALSVPAGDYDVYVLLEQPASSLKDKKAKPPAGLLKVPLTVPDYWNDQLATSSIILTTQAEQLKTPPTQDDINKNPYIFGMTRVTVPTAAKFPKKDELTIIFYIYNEGVDKTTGKPDLTVDYNFYRKADGAEKFFNRTNPQVLNATTLNPQFDVKAGHQLLGGLAIPLASFPDGDYRLEMKLTDKTTGKTKIENSLFTVTAQ